MSSGDASSSGIAPFPHTQRALRAAAAVALGAAGVASLGLYAAARSPRATELVRGEVVLYRGRPRKSVLRYLLSLGLWELSRRTTSFAVTQRRLVVERGLVRRHSHSIPLSAIGEVDAYAGLWEGVVRVSGRGAGFVPSEELGPFRAPEARALASTIARAVATSR